MRIAVFSDVHANLEALRAFVDASSAEAVDKYVFLGDAVGYGPNPNECLDEIRRLAGLEMVRGNHDSTAILKNSPYSMNVYARDAIFWTMEQLTTENLSFLQACKLRIMRDDVCYTHASPERPEAWTYVNSISEALRAFSRTRNHLCFIGHTHWPRLITRKKMDRISIDRLKPNQKILLNDEVRYIINCGSVGQPRDGNPQGSWCLYDEEEKTVVFRRFSYDNEKTAAKVREAGLPEFLAIRLKHGR